MKRIRINKGKVGLVYKRGDYSRILQAGIYWLFPREKVNIYDTSELFESKSELNILLQDEELASLLSVIEVRDKELALIYKNGLFIKVLSAGRYAYWKGFTKFRIIKADISKIELTEDIDSAILKHPELFPKLRIYRVESYEHGLLFVNDRFEKELSSGMYYYWANEVPIAVKKVDLRVQQLEISGQELLSKDKAALRISLFATYRVENTKLALLDNKDYEKQLYVQFQLALREFVGSLSLDEILERKEEVGNYVLNVVTDKAKSLGVIVKEAGVKDIILPGDIKEIMNQVLIAQKKAQANIITRREETASTRSLLNTAKLMEDNEMLFKLKEMEYVDKIADKINNISVSGGSQVLEQLKGIFTPIN